MRALLCAALILFAAPAWAANHYVRAGASGNGTDWSNACPDFTSPCNVSGLVRGDTYYIATGTYARRNFNTLASGTSVITIKGATVSDHGTDTGWSAAFSVSTADGGSQAVWGNIVSFDDSYWVFDGAVGSLTNDPTKYGFKIAQPSNCDQTQSYMETPTTSGVTLSNVTIKHVAVISCGPAHDFSQVGFNFGCGACYVTSILFSDSYVTGSQNSIGITNMANSTIERIWSENQWTSSAHHGETVAVNNCHNSDFSGCSTAFTQGQGTINVTFRYNVIKNCAGTACMAFLGPGNVLSGNTWFIYGNTFFDGQGGNGIIAVGGSLFALQNFTIYNNTFVGDPGKIVLQCEAVPACASASGNVFENNLLYLSASLLDEGTGSAITHDYNSFLSALDTPPSETHGQAVTLNPFVNYAGGDYHLSVDGVANCASTTATCTGLTLSSPYNVDSDGNTRASDGTFERGAYEFGAQGSSAGPAAAPRGFLTRPGLI